ncbi:DUF1858 domain-containing protein [Treponema pectinovorum]|uniref:DUF1858 domain-containing protein n=1 Tax=Treponema pectinovorum TaxID=164 RepID=UPI0011C7C932|nr:DUF1858 domain-containing protein [Treponema pectinovorum]
MAEVEKKVSGDMLVGQIVKDFPEAIDTLMEIGMHCLGCPSSQMESLNDAAFVHGLNPEDVVKKVNEKLNSK